MSQDSKVFFRIFLGIGLVLILISVVVFYNQFTYSKDAIHTEGVIVDTVWHSSHSRWFVVSRRCLSTDARLHANFQFEYRQRFL
ncbi:inner membrane protein [Escherichia coli]|nr:inner membrane protein [Escherichia coli]